MIDWRDTHAWLRGVSDARAGYPENPRTWPGREDAYRRGYEYGTRPIKVVAA